VGFGRALGTVMAACVDLAFLALFLWFDAPLLAWLNLGSIALYAAAYALLARRINLPALALIWTEVLGHATLGTLLIGWDSGFHYYLLMFIPATIVSGGHRTRPFVLVVLLFLFYMGLHTAARATGTLAPLSATGLWVVHAFNVAVVFAMAAYTARYYYGTVRRAEHQLVALASTDPLTGLSNRRNLIDRAEQALQQPRHAGQPTALVIADIDHFKHINDAYGHLQGDAAIQLTARVCRGELRVTDVAARLGGEEFAVLLPDMPDGRLLDLAEAIRLAVAGMQVRAELQLTTSVGAGRLRLGETLEQLQQRTDRALYRAKALGRNRSEWAD